MTLCVCGHDSREHAQFDSGEYCMACHCREYRPIHKEAVDSEESTASLSAGVTPEGLAGETVSETVNEAAERPFWAHDLTQQDAEWAYLVGRVIEERDNALAEVERLRSILAIEREAAAAPALDERLRRYADHSPECLSRGPFRTEMDKGPCDCGFGALVDEVNARLSESADDH